MRRNDLALAIVGMLNLAIGVGSAIADVNPNMSVCSNFQNYGTCTNAAECQLTNDGTCTTVLTGQKTYNHIKNLQYAIGTCSTTFTSNPCDDSGDKTSCETSYYMTTQANPDCDAETDTGCPKSTATHKGC